MNWWQTENNLKYIYFNFPNVFRVAHVWLTTYDMCSLQGQAQKTTWRYNLGWPPGWVWKDPCTGLGNDVRRVCGKGMVGFRPKGIAASCCLQLGWGWRGIPPEPEGTIVVLWGVGLYTPNSLACYRSIFSQFPAIEKEFFTRNGGNEKEFFRRIQKHYLHFWFTAEPFLVHARFQIKFS